MLNKGAKVLGITHVELQKEFSEEFPSLKDEKLIDSSLETSFFEICADITSIRMLKKKKNDLKPWNIFEKRRIEKELNEVIITKGCRHVKRRKNTLEKELNSLPRLPSCPSVIISNSVLVDNFQDLLNQKETCDQLVVLKNKTYPIHKFLFRIRCPRLAAVLGSGSQTELSEVSYQAFSLLAEYIYTGTLSNTKEFNEKIFKELAKLSSQYGLPLLSQLILKPTDSAIQFESKSTLEKDVKSIYQDNAFRDITFRIIFQQAEYREERIFRLHKMLLACRSEWFRSRFQTTWKQAPQKEIIITDIHPDVFEAFVEYLYTDNLSKRMQFFPDYLVELIQVAEQTNLPRLKEICESILFHFIDIDHAISLIQFANQYNAKQLELGCLFFLSQPENFNKIKNSERLDNSIREKLKNESETILQIMQRNESISKSISACEQVLSDIKQKTKQ